MKTYSLFLVLLIMGGPLSAIDALNRAIELASRNNPALQAMFNEYRAALEMIPQAGALADPQLMYSQLIQPVETKTGPQRAKVSINQSFPWFGARIARRNQAQNTARSIKEQFKEARSKLVFDVKSAYFQLYLQKKRIVRAAEAMQIVESLRNLALSRVESGQSSSVNAIEAEMDLAEIKNQLTSLTDQLQVLQLEFNTLINDETSPPPELPDILWASDLRHTREEIRETIITNNHQLASLRYLEQAYQSKRLAAKKSALPSFSIGLEYMFISKNDIALPDTTQNGRDAIAFPMLGLNIPLQQKKYKAMIREASFMRQAIADKITDRVNSLTVLLEKNLRRYDDAIRRIDLFKKLILLTKQSLGILETDYATDGIAFEDMLIMAKRRLQYTLELETARVDKLTSIAFIDYLAGQNKETFHDIRSSEKE